MHTLVCVSSFHLFCIVSVGVGRKQIWDSMACRYTRYRLFHESTSGREKVEPELSHLSSRGFACWKSIVNLLEAKWWWEMTTLFLREELVNMSMLSTAYRLLFPGATSQQLWLLEKKSRTGGNNMTWEQVQVQDGNSGQKTAVRMFKLGCWGFNTIISAWTTGSMCSMPFTITTQELGIHRIANHEQKYKHGSRCCWRLFPFLDRLVSGADFFVTGEILMKCCIFIKFLSPWSPCHLSTWQKKIHGSSPSPRFNTSREKTPWATPLGWSSQRGGRVAFIFKR